MIPGVFYGSIGPYFAMPSSLGVRIACPFVFGIAKSRESGWGAANSKPMLLPTIAVPQKSAPPNDLLRFGAGRALFLRLTVLRRRNRAHAFPACFDSRPPLFCDRTKNLRSRLLYPFQ